MSYINFNLSINPTTNCPGKQLIELGECINTSFNGDGNDSEVHIGIHDGYGIPYFSIRHKFCWCPNWVEYRVSRQKGHWFCCAVQTKGDAKKAEPSNLEEYNSTYIVTPNYDDYELRNVWRRTVELVKHRGMYGKDRRSV
jgi:hypothetical protein